MMKIVANNIWKEQFFSLQDYWVKKKTKVTSEYRGGDKAAVPWHCSNDYDRGR